MKVLLHPTYLPNIAQMSAMLNADDLLFEAQDNFQKQTFRNRTYIYAANGKLQLNIPVRHSQKDRKLYKDVKIAYDTDWQLIHRRSIESAYKSSPFYEYYEDEFMLLYSIKEKFLYDFNLKSISILFECLQEELNYVLNETFKTAPKDITDARELVNAKSKKNFKFEAYRQVFNEKHGFIENLSVLDLICNLGPESSFYLQNQHLNLI